MKSGITELLAPLLNHQNRADWFSVNRMVEFSVHHNRLKLMCFIAYEFDFICKRRKVVFFSFFRPIVDLC